MRDVVIQVARAFPEAIFYLPTPSRKIALTIDDVGDASTEIILDVLNRYPSVSATFFIITGFLSDRRLIAEILKRGHEIGNHGVYDRTHADFIPDFEREFIEAHEILSDTNENIIKWFRPGRGRYNYPMARILKDMAAKYGYNPLFALASMVPLDTFELTGSPLFTLAYIERFIFPGAILILHGGSKLRSLYTAEVLRELLPRLLDRGYEVVSLSELYGDDNSL